MRLSFGPQIVIPLLLWAADAHAHDGHPASTRMSAGTLGHALGTTDTTLAGQYWRSKLVSAGVLPASGPVRVAIPLWSFDTASTKLMLAPVSGITADRHGHRIMIVLHKQIE